MRLTTASDIHFATDGGRSASRFLCAQDPLCANIIPLIAGNQRSKGAQAAPDLLPNARCATIPLVRVRFNVHEHALTSARAIGFKYCCNK
jgi:hypothetical protein